MTLDIAIQKITPKRKERCQYFTIWEKRRRMIDYWDVLEFWFSEDNYSKIFIRNKKFDEEIRTNFFGTWERAKQGLFFEWRKDLRGRLAEIIILDQFSRHLFRNDRRAYEQDAMALVLAQELMSDPYFVTLYEEERNFAMMPFMHSESYELHLWAEEYFHNYTGEATIEFEEQHKLILEKFGRFPYRNRVLGRESTEEEERLFEQSMGDFFFPEELLDERIEVK